jgi:nicotinic acid phosphoribosyltransferase
MKSFFEYLKDGNLSLFTDFYELTMCASYFDNKNFETATFDLFIRRLPENRSYFLFAGLEEASAIPPEQLNLLRSSWLTLRSKGLKEIF